MRNFWQLIIFAWIFVLAILLIENEGDSILVEIAGDVFGALALCLVGVRLALRED